MSAAFSATDLISKSVRPTGVLALTDTHRKRLDNRVRVYKLGLDIAESQQNKNEETKERMPRIELGRS